MRFAIEYLCLISAASSANNQSIGAVTYADGATGLRKAARFSSASHVITWTRPLGEGTTAPEIVAGTAHYWDPGLPNWEPEIPIADPRVPLVGGNRKLKGRLVSSDSQSRISSDRDSCWFAL